ncbi:MAG: DUF4013 domain-containing protein [Myxococcales bacterium]|jgi:hypothetical protein
MAARTIDFERPFNYVFKDPGWVQKVLLGGLFHLLSVVLVGAFVSLGYQKKLFLALVDDENAPLPEFDVGKDLAEGVPIFGIPVVYCLASVLMALIPCVGTCVSMLMGLAAMIVVPASLTRYFVTNRFSAAFELDQVFAYIKQNLSNLALYVAMTLIVGVLSSIGTLACIVGAFFVSFWGALVTTRALAETYRLSMEQPAQPSEPPAEPASY